MSLTKSTIPGFAAVPESTTFQSVTERRRSAECHRLAVIAGTVLCFAICSGFTASAQVVAQYNFDDGTADGWVPFDSANTPVATTAAAYSGSYSLLTTTGSSGQGGPGISVTGILLPGATYQITGYVMLTSGESVMNANFTMRRSDPACSGGTCFDTIGTYQVPVSATGWAQIGGTYTVSATETGLFLYAQLVGATIATSFYLDDVIITETAPPPAMTTLATYTFADGGLDGWAPFGSPTLTNAAPPILDPHSDTHSLLVTNRTAGFMGPSLNLLSVPGVAAGGTYQVTAYVLLAAPDSSNPTATLSTRLTNCASPSGSSSNLATSGALSSTAWTKLQGTFSFSNSPGPPTGLILYIQSSSATDSFYIDDVSILELAPPPNPGQQDNTGITTTFADGGLDGWSSHSGSSTLTNTAPPVLDPNGDARSLLITGRVGNFDGPQINVSNKMYNGSRYSISVWVLLQPVDNSNHIINMSLQVTLGGNTSNPSVTSYPGVTVPADGHWHQISVSGYNMSNSYTAGEAYLYLQTVPASGNDLVSFYIDDFQLTYVVPPTIQTNLASIYQTLSAYFPVGAAVDTTDLSGPHAQLLTQHFNSIVSENDMTWSSVENALGTYTYTNADSEVGLAACNNMLVRGHNLVWASGKQTPAYATGDGTNSPANQATVTANIQEHIQSEVTHFGSKVYAWDVVDEPIDPTQPDCLYHGPFYQVLGKSYIDIALQAARQYAPAGTLLFINAFSTTDPEQLACLISVVQDLQSRGIPIDGVGHEMHNFINYPSAAAIVNAIQTVSSTFPGLVQHITEMDMSVYNDGDNTSNYGAAGGTVPASVLAQQGYLYAQDFTALRQLTGMLSAVTFWGFADDDTWLDSFPIARLDEPLPFSTTLQAKPAYWGIVDPTQLPGYGLSFALSGETGPQNARVWTVTASNPSTGTAYATQITGFTLKQLSGAACAPVITPPSSFPVVLGDIPADSTASAQFTIDFTGCGSLAAFTLTMPWTAANGAQTGTLTVTPLALLAIAVTPPSPSITKGLTQQFTATGAYTDGSTANITDQVTWGSATTSVATIAASGVATGVGVGTSNITASLGGITSPSDTLTVTPPALVSIAVTPVSPSISRGSTQQFTATGTYSDSSTANITGLVTWNSATTSVATIAAGGLATAEGTGTSNITASLSGITSPAATLSVTAAFVTGFALNSPAVRNNFTGFVGLQLTAGADALEVSSLGRVCVTGNTGTHTVKLVSVSSQTDLPGGTATVNMAGCTAGQFVYANLASPVTLPAGGAYYLVSQETSGGDQFYGQGTITTTNDAAAISSVYSNGSGWSAPGPANTSYVPPNMIYQLVEPPPQPAYVQNYNLNNQPLRNDLTGFAGMSLTVGPTSVTAITVGRVCVGGNTQSHIVKFVSAATGMDVPGGSATVNMTGCTASQFVYAPLPAPLTLQANTGYYLVSQEISGGDQFYDQGTVTTTQVATVADSVYWNGSGWVNGSANTSYVPPNFQYKPASIGPSGFLTGYALNSPALRNNFSGFAGMSFMTEAFPLSASTVGRLCVAGNSETHTVKFVNALTGVDVVGGSAWVNMANCTPGQFVFAPLANPVTLLPGATYYLVSGENSGGDQWYDMGQVSSTADASVAGAVYWNGTSYIVTAKPNTAYVPPSFQYTVLPQVPQPLVTEFNLSNAPLRNNFTGPVGMALTVGADSVSVTSLGRVCVAGNSQTHTVWLINAGTGTAVPGSAASVSMASCTPGQFAYSALATPVTLNAGTSYYLVSGEQSGGDQWYDLGPLLPTTAAQVTNGAYLFNGAWQVSGGPNTSFGPPNLLYEILP